MKKMRVLEINVDDHGMGGVYSLIRNVILHKPINIKIDIASIVHFEDREHIAEMKSLGVNVYYIGSNRSILFKPYMFYKKLKKLLIIKAYDCVHIHSDVAYMLLIFSKAAKDAGIKKIILHSHAAGIDRGRRITKRILHELSKPVLKKYATDFVACSDYAARWMYSDQMVKDVKMINNGVDIHLYTDDPEKRNEVRKKLGIESAFVIGNIGRLSYQKNQKYLIKIFSRIIETIPSAKLLIIGEGELKAELVSLAQELNVLHSVIFYGTSNCIASLLQAMDVFLLTSWFEGLPVVGVEAQAVGLPVLFSSNITRQAQINSMVYYLPVGRNDINKWVDEIKNIYNFDLNELKKSRAIGSKNVVANGFTIDVTVQQFLELYR